MKKLNRVVAFALTFLLLISTIQINVRAENSVDSTSIEQVVAGDEESSNNTQTGENLSVDESSDDVKLDSTEVSGDNSQTGLSTEESQSTEDGILNSGESDVNVESDETNDSSTTGVDGLTTTSDYSDLINYVYVESPVVTIGSIQYVVVSIGDGSNEIINPVLTYQDIESGNTYTFVLEQNVSGILKFSKEFTDSNDLGEYVLTNISYSVNDQEYSVNLSEIGINSSFVVQEKSDESINQSVVTLDSDNEEVTSEDISGAVDSLNLDAEEDTQDLYLSTSGSLRSLSLASVSLSSAQSNVVIVLDPGHGGTDSGATRTWNGVTYYEKNINLKIAQYAKEALEEYTGITVYMTRYSDTYVSLSDRATVAKNVSADSFISLHANTASSESADGAEIYYPNTNYRPDLSTIGQGLASAISSNLAAVGLTNRGIKTRTDDTSDPYTYADGSTADYYGVIRLNKQNGVPAVIVEHAFMSNQNDCVNYLGNDEALKKLGEADAKAIAEYYGLSKSKPIATKIEVLNKNLAQGTFDVQVSGVSPTNSVDYCTVGVWTKSDLSDVRYIKTTKVSDGVYKATLNMADYGYFEGTYNIQTFAINYSGTSYFLLETTTNMNLDTIRSNVSISAVATDSTEKSYTITASNLQMTNLENVSFAVWSDVNGQDDLKWYTATNISGTNNYQCTIDIANHASIGQYQVHMYVVPTKGTSSFTANSTFVVNKNISASNIEVINEDKANHRFSIKLSGINCPAGVSVVQFAVWTKNDQSDLVWYNGTRQSDGSYIAIVNTSNHDISSSTIKYKIDAYIADARNTCSYVIGMTKNIEINQSYSISVSDVSSTQSTYNLKLQGLSNLIAKKVVFKVYNGSNTSYTKEYVATYNASTSSWSTNFNVKDFAKGGTYTVNAIMTSTSGVTSQISSTTFNVDAPSASNLEVTSYDKSTGVLNIKLSGINAPANINCVQFAVWSQSNQSDIQWYTATKQSDGTYTTSVNILNHGGNIGKYTIHAYIVDDRNISKCVKQASYTVERPTYNLKATATDSTAVKFNITAENLPTSNVKLVTYAVWSKSGGQDDLKWYDATNKSGTATWQTTVDIRNHRTAGDYIVDAYIVDSNGKVYFISEATFNVQAITASSVSIENYDSITGTFQVKVSGINTPATVTNVQIPVWSKSNQSDLIWYNATKQSDGSYVANVSIIDHNCNTGKYYADVYVVDSRNLSNVVGSTAVNVTKPTYSITCSATDSTQSKYYAKIDNINVNNAQSVWFAVWSNESGQDDIVWYEAKNIVGTNSWSTTIPINNHKSFGTYLLHAYVITNQNASRFVSSTTFDVTAPSMGSISITNVDNTLGKLDVILSGISSPAEITKVQVPIWSKADQSDIKWYTATKQSNGTYIVNMDVANHNSNSGVYNFHVYVTDTRGIITKVGETTYNFQHTNTGLYTIMGSPSVTIAQMVAYYKASGKTYPAAALSAGGAPTIEDFCRIFYEEALAEGVKIEVAYTQTIKETGWLQFDGDVSVTQFNFAGIGAVGGGAAGSSFPDVRTGIRAQIQHLKAYASSDPLVNACVDPRFKYVTRGTAPYVQWLGIQENPWGKGWATAANYGYQIVAMIAKLKNY